MESYSEIETPAAKVGCRPALTVETAPMNTNNYDYMNWGEQKIVINEDLIRSNKTEAFQQAIKTLLHESRHAFQYSNMRWNALSLTMRNTSHGY